MPLPTLTSALILADQRGEWLYTHIRLGNDPHAKALSKKFGTYEPSWAKAVAIQQQLQDDLIRANIQVDQTDIVLDALVDRVNLAIQVAIASNHPASLFALFFAGVAPSLLKRPVLGAELEAMRPWPKLLQDSGVDALMALSKLVLEAVAAGDAAVAARKDAIAALDHFSALGAGKALLDQLNKLRDNTYGTLRELRTDNPKWGVPADWADSFFQHDLQGTHQGNTEAELEAKVNKLAAQLQKANQALADRRAKTAAAGQARAAQAALDAQIAAADQEVKDAAKKAKALKAQKGKKLPTP